MRMDYEVVSDQQGNHHAQGWGHLVRPRGPVECMRRSWRSRFQPAMAGWVKAIVPSCGRRAEW
ncbi:hypothetical protein ACLB1R_04305 [Escherichia coli]